jgi:predicted MFS family arabinose efflux permease
MSATAPAGILAPAGSGGQAPRRLWPLLACLGVTQTVGYGVLSYAFAVYLTPMAHDLHASTATVTGALTTAVLVAAVAAIPVGRWLGRHGGRGLMTTGSVIGTLAVAAWSQATTVLGLYLIFGLIGIAAAMVLYEAAFAVIIAATPTRRRAGAIVSVTIVAGFASTVFLPLTAALVDRYGWRSSLIILAVLFGAITIPLHAITVPRGSTRSSPGDEDSNNRSTAIRTALRDGGFWWMGLAFTVHSAAITTVAVHLIGYLGHLGHSTTFAATVTGMLGILSVTGRLVTTGLGRRWPPATITALIFALQAVAVGALPMVGRSSTGAVVCVLLFGLGFGVGTIARPTLLADRYGTRDYATIAGVLTAPVTIAKATGPLLAALLLTTTGSYLPVMAAVSAGCLLAALGLALSRADDAATDGRRSG